MRLALYSLNFWPELTGVGKYSGEMARWMADRGHEVRVVTAPPYYPEWEVSAGYRAGAYARQQWGAAGAPVHIVRCPLYVPARVTTLRRLVHLASFALTSLPALWQTLRRRPDVLVVLAPTMMVAPAAWLLSRLFRVPCWLHVQDFEVEAMFGLTLAIDGRTDRVRGAVRRAALAMESWMLRRFDRVSSITPRMVERLVHKGVAPSRTVLFPNWVDLSTVFPMQGANAFRAALGLGDDEVLVLYSGNLGEKQGLEIVVDAARELQHALPQLRFVIAGSGAARPRLEAQAQGLANLQWLPLQPLEKLNEMLNAADIHVLPQRADAADLVMPSKLIGMLASGRATVGTAAAATQLGQVLDQAGRRVDPGDLPALVEALRSLALDRQQRERLGVRGRAYAEQHFGQPAILQRVESQLRALAGGAASA